MLNSLVEKRILRVRQEGKRYLYRPLESKNKVGLSALRELVRNFFGGQPSDAVAALLEGGASRLSPEEIARIKQLIDQAENAP
jgi:predicted transcriptional regulator